MSRRPRHLPAFTLFEMVAVILILGIIAAALIPPLGNNIYSPRLRTSANVLAADIDYCASESIAQPGSPRAITFDLTNNRYSLINFNAASVITHPADGKPYTNDFSTGRNLQQNGVRIQSVTSAGNAVTAVAFDAYGRPILSADLIITLTYNSQTLTLTVKYTTGDVAISGG